MSSGLDVPIYLFCSVYILKFMSEVFKSEIVYKSRPNNCRYETPKKKNKRGFTKCEYIHDYPIESHDSTSNSYR